MSNDKVFALSVTVMDGKYTFIQEHSGRCYALRYGDSWRDCTGDGLMLALAQEIEELEIKLQEANKDLKDLQDDYQSLEEDLHG